MDGLEPDMTIGVLVDVRIMGNNYNGFSLIIQLLQDFQHIIPISFIKTASRFVSEYNLRGFDNYFCQCYTLLLTAA